MNSPSHFPTEIYPSANFTAFEQLLHSKSHNFVGRQFVFSAFADFLHYHDRGYFTLIGLPGSGKSAILAKYVTQHPQVLYYNAQLPGFNRADQFFTTLSPQLIHRQLGGHVEIPSSTTVESSFLALLLQDVSDRSHPEQPLIIAIDGLDAIDRTCQSIDANLFYLPRYLPPHVYFLLSRRPFVKEKSGLLVEAPSQILDLEQYPEHNENDIRLYIHQYLEQLEHSECEFGVNQPDDPTVTIEQSRQSNLVSWLNLHQTNYQEFSEWLQTNSQNNFMYLSQMFEAISQGFYSQHVQLNTLPTGLEAYYQNHWQRMQAKGLSAVKLAVLNVFIQQDQPLSVEEIAQVIEQDEYDVETVLEHWWEFLHLQHLGDEVRYSLYHSSFRQFLSRFTTYSYKMI